MRECRKDRQKRLIEVYDHLRQHFGIHTKTGFAEAVKYGRTSMSAAMNGKEEYLTDDLFEKICEAYPGVFDLNYLLTGEGTLLTIEEEVHNQDMEKLFNPSPDQMTANILEMYARMIRGVDDLRVQLKDQLSEIQTVRSELQHARDDFRDATYRLTQALTRLNNQAGTTNNIPFAADDGDK